jgi:hypothetical protein
MIISSLKSLPKNELNDLVKALARLAESPDSDDSSSPPSSPASAPAPSPSVSAAKAKKSKKEVKAESEDEEEPVAEKPKKEKKVPAPKGPVPPQLMKNKLWVDFVLEDALKNGWPEFVKTLKGQEVVMPASILHGEYNIFDGSVTKAAPHGSQPSLGDAMPLSKMYWSAKECTGTREDLWELFMQAYEIEESPSVVVVPKKTVRRTLDEYNAERAAAKIVNDAIKAEKKAKDAEERKRVSDEKKALKEEEAAQKKAEKEAAKAEKEAEKLSKSGKKVPVKAAAVVKASTAVKLVKAPVAAKAPVKVPAKKALVPEPIQIPVEEEELCLVDDEEEAEETPEETTEETEETTDEAEETTDEAEWLAGKDEGDMRLWKFKGVTYWRDNEDIIYNSDEEGAVVGVYCPMGKFIDESRAGEAQ